MIKRVRWDSQTPRASIHPPRPTATAYVLPLSTATIVRYRTLLSPAGCLTFDWIHRLLLPKVRYSVYDTGNNKKPIHSAKFLLVCNINNKSSWIDSSIQILYIYSSILSDSSQYYVRSYHMIRSVHLYPPESAWYRHSVDSRSPVSGMAWPSMLCSFPIVSALATSLLAYSASMCVRAC